MVGIVLSKYLSLVKMIPIRTEYKLSVFDVELRLLFKLPLHELF